MSSIEEMESELEEEKRRMFEFSGKGKWKEVIEMYEKDARLHKAKISRTGDAALHIAVTEGNEEAVARMVEVVCSCSEQEALQTQNARGNTALHLAASIGNVSMCQLIGEAESSLSGIRNVDGETPLFLAVRYGNKQAFLCLHYLCNGDPSSHNYARCRRYDGDTILHSAITSEYFDLAFQIIDLYKDLVNWVNEDGLSPLHLLAAKPSVFRSGSYLGRFQMIIYHCILVEKLEEEKYEQPPPSTARKQKRIGPHVPNNYNTCSEVFRVLKTSLAVVTNNFIFYRYFKKKDARKEDEVSSTSEDPELAKDNTDNRGSKAREEGHWLYPTNYGTCYNLVKFFYLVVMLIIGEGWSGLEKIKQKKEKHTWSVQIMNKLLFHASLYQSNGDGSKPQESPFAMYTNATNPYDERPSCYFKIVGNNAILKTSRSHQQQDNEYQKDSITRKNETAILIAAKNGVTEMVERILESFPMTIHDINEEKKNVVLLAVEHRQAHVYQLLLQRNFLIETIFRKVDNKGNSALHLAAKLGDYKPCLIPGPVLMMQWEMKWFELVENSVRPNFFVQYNNHNKTPRDIFTETHIELVKSGEERLHKISESCWGMAAMIATVAFATTAAVPGGVDQSTGHPTLEREPAFNLFAISSLIALCCSITAVVVFLSLLTSRCQEHDFRKVLPRKLIVGLTSLFVSIVSMMVSFCAGHYFVLKDQLKYAALPIYAVTSLPVILYALAQFPLYFNLIWATFEEVPQRSYKTTPRTSKSSGEGKHGKEE